MSERVPNIAIESSTVIMDAPPPLETNHDITGGTHEQLITDDIEILGESRHLRRSLRSQTRDTFNEVHTKAIKLRDVSSKPRQKYLEILRDRNELKIQRLEEKIASDPEGSSIHFKRDREWLAMYKARRNHRIKQLDQQASNRVAWGNKLATKLESRHERYQQHIDKYIHKKIDALRKKEFRHLQQEQGIGRLDYREQAEFFRRLPEQEKYRITQEAILAAREKNIDKGRLDEDYVVDPGEVRRSIDNYERVVR